jgi:hypothetical protein
MNGTVEAGIIVAVTFAVVIGVWEWLKWAVRKMKRGL